MISYERSHCKFWCLDMQMSIFHQDLLWFFSIVSITCFVQLRSLPEIFNPLRDEILFVISVSRLSSQGSPAICPLPLPGSSEPAYVTWQHLRNEASECVLSCCRDQDFWSFLSSFDMKVCFRIYKICKIYLHIKNTRYSPIQWWQMTGSALSDGTMAFRQLSGGGEILSTETTKRSGCLLSFKWFSSRSGCWKLFPLVSPDLAGFDRSKLKLTQFIGILDAPEKQDCKRLLKKITSKFHDMIFPPSVMSLSKLEHQKS